MILGDKIAARRKELNMSIEQLATKSNVPIGTLKKIINGVTLNPQLETVKSIAYAMNMTLSDFDEFASRENGFTESEKAYIKKYRNLDDYGKRAIDELLETEHERCTVIEEDDEDEPEIEIKHSIYKVSAGTGFELDDEGWETIYIPDTYENRKADFAVTIKGDSMEPMYYDGDIVLVKEQPCIDVGQVGVYTINDKGYIKKCGSDGLISLNDDYDDIIPDENDNVRCIGKVIGRL